jgi:hypothetical protein
MMLYYYYYNYYVLSTAIIILIIKNNKKIYIREAEWLIRYFFQTNGLAHDVVHSRF